jgi:hypothetical protein
VSGLHDVLGVVLEAGDASRAMLVFSRWLRLEAEKSKAAAAGADGVTLACGSHRFKVLHGVADEVTRQRLEAEG